MEKQSGSQEKSGEAKKTLIDDMFTVTPHNLEITDAHMRDTTPSNTKTPFNSVIKNVEEEYMTVQKN